MAYYEFDKDDIFHNVVKTYPKNEFHIFPLSGAVGSFRIVHNSKQPVSGAFTSNVVGTTPGSLSLYEINIDKLSGSNNVVYPFVTKQSGMHALKTVGTTTFWNNSYGDILTGSYHLSSSLHREYWIETENHHNTRKHISALRNTLDYYIPLSKHYEYDNTSHVPEASGRKWSKQDQAINLISVPSMFFGEAMKKGTVNLKYYVTGTLIGELKDEKRNGELIQVGPKDSTGSGSVAGVVLYNEGFLLLTGSWVLNSEPKDYINSGSDTQLPSTWLQYGAGIPGKAVGAVTGSHYTLKFDGVNKIPTLTMMAYAKKAEVNNSNNPTFLTTDTYIPTISSGAYAIVEDPMRKVYNTVDTKYVGTTGSFQKQTFISKIKIYDENMNCIGEAKLARPVKKTEERDLLFKLKIDF